MGIINNLLKSIGITDSIEEENKEKLTQHKEFLKSLLDEERSRLDNIEAKTSQLISQTSLIISLASLFIPLLIDKSNDVNLIWKVLFVLILFTTYLFYILTISNALKNYNVKKFEYASPSPQNVLDFKDKPLNKFNEELIKDYLYSIDKNQKLNNIKATNVLNSYKKFKIANILLSILVVSVCIFAFFTNENSTKIEIQNPVKIKLTEPVKLLNAKLIDSIYETKKDTLSMR